MLNGYVLILLWALIILSISNNPRYKHVEPFKDDFVEKQNAIFSIIAFLPVILFAGSRGYIADTSAYIYHYGVMPSNIGGFFDYIRLYPKDWGFSLISILIKTIIGSDYRPYLFLLSLFQGLSLANYFRKYSIDFGYSFFLFIASAEYFLWMFNGLRQFLAVTIILFAVPSILEKKTIKWILIVLLASTIHRTALILIPAGIIVRGRAWNKKTILFIAATILAIVFVAQFTTVLDSSLEGTQYENVVSEYTAAGDDGTNPIRVFVYTIPTIIAFFKRKIIEEIDDVLVHLAVNMSIISTGLYLISMVTSGIFLGRLPIYFSLFNYILLPWEIENCFNMNSRSVRVLSIIAYIGYYLFQMHFISKVI